MNEASHAPQFGPADLAKFACEAIIKHAGGARYIMVGDLRFARIMVDHLGSNGVRYWFNGMDSMAVMDGPKRTIHRTRVYVNGDKLERQNAILNKEPVPAPADQRILETAQKLIREGAIRHPDTIAYERGLRQAESKAMADAETKRTKLERAAPEMFRTLKLIASTGMKLEPSAIVQAAKEAIEGLEDIIL